MLLFASIIFFFVGFFAAYLYTQQIALIISMLVMGLISLILSLAILSRIKVEVVKPVNKTQTVRSEPLYYDYEEDYEEDDDDDDEDDEWDDDDDEEEKERLRKEKDWEEYMMYEDDN